MLFSKNKIKTIVIPVFGAMEGRNVSTKEKPGIFMWKCDSVFPTTSYNVEIVVFSDENGPAEGQLDLYKQIASTDFKALKSGICEMVNKKLYIIPYRIIIDELFQGSYWWTFAANEFEVAYCGMYRRAFTTRKLCTLKELCSMKKLKY